MSFDFVKMDNNCAKAVCPKHCKVTPARTCQALSKHLQYVHEPELLISLISHLGLQPPLNEPISGVSEYLHLPHFVQWPTSTMDPPLGGSPPDNSPRNLNRSHSLPELDSDDDDEGYWMVVEAAKSSDARLARRRGSDLGRNLKGVWKTEAADEGGL